MTTHATTTHATGASPHHPPSAGPRGRPHHEPGLRERALGERGHTTASPAPVLLSALLSALFAACASDAAPRDPENPEILLRPFTAAEIREEMVEGFSLDLVRRIGAEVVIERWTVLEADEEGVRIRYQQLDDDGEVIAELREARHAWVELQNHATFPADRSTRREATRDTALGRLEGWLYTVREPDLGVVSELFFARSLPGPPVELKTRLGDQVSQELEQIARRRPR